METYGTNDNWIGRLLAIVSGGANAADAAEHEAARQFKELIEEIPGGFLIYRATEGEEILYANRALLDIFQCGTQEEFRAYTGNSFRGVVYKDDLESVEKSISEQIDHNGNNLDYVEYRIRRRDGAIRWIEDYGHYVHTQSLGGIYYVFLTDATEKVQQRILERAEFASKETKLQNQIEEYDKERKLIRQEHLQRLEVIEGLSVNYETILYADPSADAVLPYRLSSRTELQFERKLQTKSYRLFLNEYAEAWVHPEDRANFLEHTSPEYVKAKLSDSPTFYCNYRCLQNGEVKYLQLRVVTVSGTDDDYKIVLGARSIDEEILREIKQKQLVEEALVAANLSIAAKNTFLSNMSHDMRTPLNAVFGFTALARKYAGDKEKTEYYLDAVEKAGRQLLDSVEKVLEISYAESQDCTIAEDVCDVEQMLRETYDEILPDAEEKGLELSLQTYALPCKEVKADGEKLKQILLHLAHNAVKYTKKGGKVILSASEEIPPSGEFAAFRFSVEDTGVGISKDSLERIFKPFERINNTTQSGVYGAGLGLTIARRVAEKMGGAIEVKSEPGKGSVFTLAVNLRLNRGDTAEETGSADFTGLKILLVEDNEFNLEIETEVLQDLGFEVDSAENGKIAVEKIQNSSPGEYAFVLMDIQMPVMDGREAAEAIRKSENPDLADIPIIALSANAFESDKRASAKAGMNAHLSKPLDVNAFTETVKRVLATTRRKK